MNRKKLFKQSVWLAMASGVVLALYVSLTMVWEMSIELWLIINNLLVIATLVIAAVVGYQHRTASTSFVSMQLSIAVFYLVIMLMYVGSYAATTAFLADKIVWMPLFYHDYTYHGFASPADYLNHNDNFRQLIILQIFSFLIASVMYFGAGSLGYVAGVVIEHLRRPRASVNT